LKVGTPLCGAGTALVVLAVGVGVASFAIARASRRPSGSKQALEGRWRRGRRSSRADSWARCCTVPPGVGGRAHFRYEPVGWRGRGRARRLFLQGATRARCGRCAARRGYVPGAARGASARRAAAAEAPSKSTEPDQADWLHAVGRASSRSFGSGDLAFELLRHPVTGAVVSRAWRAAEASRGDAHPRTGRSSAFCRRAGLPADARSGAEGAPAPGPEALITQVDGVRIARADDSRGSRIAELTWRTTRST